MSAAERATADANVLAPAETAARVPPRWLAAYGAIEAPVGGALNATSLFLGFQYASLGVRLEDVGWILMAARLLDVGIDPAVGLLSDRTRNRFGRRKTWIVAGAPIFVLATWRLFNPAPGVTAGDFALWLVLFWLGFSMINIPYYAWGAEISPDYHERTRITNWRTVFGTLGTFGYLAVAAVRQQLTGAGGTPGEVLAMVSVAAAAGVPLLVAFAAASVPDRSVGGAPTPLARGVGVMAGNGPFLRLLAAFTIVGLGPVLQGAMFPFFMQHVVGDSTSGPKLLLVYYPTVMLGIALWGALARRIDKHRAWMVGMGVMVVATASYLAIGRGNLLGMVIILAVSGIGSGALTALPASMKADVVDLDSVESGEDRAGLYFAAWSLAVKLIAAMGQGLAFTTLAWIGFQAKGTNGPDEILGLRIFYAGGPMLLYLVALAIVWGYPITAARHAELRAELAARGPRARVAP